jgi:hypothetical protein
VTAAAIRHRRHRRRSGALLLVVGMVCALASAFFWRIGSPAHAETTFSSFDLQAGARGWRFFMEDPTNGNQEGEVPESSTTLAQGPVGYGLSSVVWPGPLASNLGSLLLVLRPDAPSQATALNNPVRAEARSGQNPPTTKNDSVPGTSMSATALPELVEAEALVNSSSGPGTFGPSRTHAISKLEGPIGKGIADSLVQNINVAAGVVKIDSVTSTAAATTDGTKSDGEAHTVVNGLTIGGQKATIDEHGLRIGDGTPNAVANQVAQQALGKSGTTITMGAATKESDGATTTVTAGSLVISWDTGGGQIFTVSIGGASATVTAAPGTDVAPSPIDTAPAPGSASVGTPTDTGSGTLPSTSGAASTPASTSGAATAPAASSGSPAVASPKLQLARYPKVLSTGSVVLAAFAAGLMGIGMRRLGDGILAEPTAAVCPLAEDD